MRSVVFYRQHFAYPPKKEPDWKSRCERWYQLDAPAYGMTEGCSRFVNTYPTLLPPQLILCACPGASNLTDFKFAQTGAVSPAQFVHTLPNVRLSSVLQVMGWSAQVLCLQDGPNTRAHALFEAFKMSQAEEQRIWVMSFDSKGDSGAEIQIWAIDLATDPTVETPFSIQNASHDLKLVKDLELLNWFEKPTLSLSLGGGLSIHYKEKREGV